MSRLVGESLTDSERLLRLNWLNLVHELWVSHWEYSCMIDVAAPFLSAFHLRMLHCLGRVVYDSLEFCKYSERPCVSHFYFFHGLMLSSLRFTKT